MNSQHQRVVPSGAEARAVLCTVRDLVRYASTRFHAAELSFGHGSAAAFDEAAYLVLWALHLSPERLEPFWDARLTAAEISSVLELIERRCVERVPASYLTGEAWLRGLRFKSDARALVPRSLIAEALDESFAIWLETHPPAAPAWPARVLDLCTGGGSIAVFAADCFPQAAIVASDCSEAALELAAENIELHGCSERIELLHGDLYAPLGEQRFDLILCNPPYVNSAAMAALPAEFLAEPQAALAGGSDGMDLVRRILAGAVLHLESDGILLLEIGHEAEHFEQAFPTLEFSYLEVTAGAQMLVLVTRAQIAAAIDRTPDSSE